ncbi:hypothetical protein SPHINGOT1_270171 [Sphingomonas sp. T1]|nr:hypothetical protein SPHINGOT1_270171 [Sphingomonas sp. T1]
MADTTSNCRITIFVTSHMVYVCRIIRLQYDYWTAWAIQGRVIQR